MNPAGFEEQLDPPDRREALANEERRFRPMDLSSTTSRRGSSPSHRSFPRRHLPLSEDALTEDVAFE